jgi:hypothetical protein
MLGFFYNCSLWGFVLCRAHSVSLDRAVGWCATVYIAFSLCEDSLIRVADAGYFGSQRCAGGVTMYVI